MSHLCQGCNKSFSTIYTLKKHQDRCKLFAILQIREEYERERILLKEHLTIELEKNKSLKEQIECL